ncbi:MAG TPA: UdgX family uracil-DNA binding protein [Rhizomicrobium sp.]|jgi:DNA polymerase
MQALHLSEKAGIAEFRMAARHALANAIPPGELMFSANGQQSLFEELKPEADEPAMTAPRAYAELLRDVICHRAADRFALLYQVLWRLKHGEPQLLERASDPAIAALALYAKSVHRDIHKMHAFVRFHAKQTEDGEVFVAWFEPEHFILERATPFFADRFASMRWIIATPDGTALWDGNRLSFAPPGPKPDTLDDPILDGAWPAYYRAIFNPARLNIPAMTREMPRKYWHNMPETALIQDLVAETSSRLNRMDREPDHPPRFAAKAAPRPKHKHTGGDEWDALRSEAAHCTACPLYKHATQTVFGEGPRDARIVLVGEQPGDSEDIAGHPFVGPAGQLLDRALNDAGIERSKTYVTNAVKHFKFSPRGKRRIHQRPTHAEVKICHQWLAREFALLEPSIVVALGATAALSLSGRAVTIGEMRGKELRWNDGSRGLLTVHPSYLLRLPDEAAKREEYGKFVADLRTAARLAELSS